MDHPKWCKNVSWFLKLIVKKSKMNSKNLIKYSGGDYENGLNLRRCLLKLKEISGQILKFYLSCTINSIWPYAAPVDLDSFTILYGKEQFWLVWWKNSVFFLGCCLIFCFAARRSKNLIDCNLNFVPREKQSRLFQLGNFIFNDFWMKRMYSILYRTKDILSRQIDEAKDYLRQ